MDFAAGPYVKGRSPIAAAMTASLPPRPPPQRSPPPRPARPARLSDRLDAEIAALQAHGRRICWIEIGKSDLLTLFRERGEEAVRLDPDPARDCGWFGAYEVRYASRELVCLMTEAEDGGRSLHVLD